MLLLSKMSKIFEKVNGSKRSATSTESFTEEIKKVCHNRYLYPPHKDFS